MVVKSIKSNIPIRVYGDGSNVRDWIYVIDHCIAIDLIYNQGENGSIYNVAGKNEMTNLGLIDMIYSIIGEKYTKSINFIHDRFGHDKRYSVDISKISTELSWKPSFDIAQTLSNLLKKMN